MAKKGYNYFDAFVDMAQYACDAANYLVETLNNFDVHEMGSAILACMRLKMRQMASATRSLPPVHSTDCP